MYHTTPRDHRTFNPALNGADAVHQQAATHQKHGCCADNRQAFHQPRGKRNQASSHGLHRAAVLAHEPVAHIVHPHNAGHQTIHKHGDGNRDSHQYRHLLGQWFISNGAQRNGQNFCRQNKVGSNSAADFLLFVSGGVNPQLFALAYRRRGQTLGLSLLGFLYRVVRFAALVQRMHNFLDPFKAQKCPTNHQQRGNQPRSKSADEQKRRHQNHFVEQRALGHAPHHG